MTQVCLHKPTIHKKTKTFSSRFYECQLRLLYNHFYEIVSAREAKIKAQIEGVRWAEKNAGRASGQWAEAYFFLAFL